MGECHAVLGQLAGMEVSKGSLHKVPVVHLKAEKLGPRVWGVKEVMFEWFSFARRMSGQRMMRSVASLPIPLVIDMCCYTFQPKFSFRLEETSSRALAQISLAP